jgi:endoglucanase
MRKLIFCVVIFFSSSCFGNYEPLNANKISFDNGRWYQMTHAEAGVEELFDGKLTSTVSLVKNKLVANYEIYYPFSELEVLNIDQIRMYDAQGSNSVPFTIFVIDQNWKRVKIAEFTGEHYNKWVGPNPRQPENFNVIAKVQGIRYLVLQTGDGFPTELEFYGTYKMVKPPVTAIKQKSPLSNFFGVNAFEWDFVDSKKDAYTLEQKRVDAIRSFGGIRHYLDWERIEAKEGLYTFNPSHSGGWNYDTLYSTLKDMHVDVLVCLKTLPKWLQETYPGNLRDNENVPIKSGKSLNDPSSYIEQAKAAFQFAARYGYNKAVQSDFVKVNSNPRWEGDKLNQMQKGLGLIKYIECDNERDKWWKGRKAYQTGREYAANLSAFYDGHKQKLGKDVGVKNADPSMKVVMAGLADPSTDYVRGMIDWCRENRGFRKDGSIDLCWDIINFHYYTNESSLKRGVAPELLSNDKYAVDLAASFIQLSQSLNLGIPVWVTEAGYDLDQNSPNKSIPINEKNALQTQADWILRTSLMYSRSGVEKVFFYQLRDDNPGSGKIYGSSGLINKDFSDRPASRFLKQTNELFGGFTYVKSLNTHPILDYYTSIKNQELYIAYIPKEVGSQENLEISLPGKQSATIYTPAFEAASMSVRKTKIENGRIIVSVSETPIFILVD